MGHGGRIGSPEHGGRLRRVASRAEPAIELAQVLGGRARRASRSRNSAAASVRASRRAAASTAATSRGASAPQRDRAVGSARSRRPPAARARDPVRRSSSRPSAASRSRAGDDLRRARGRRRRRRDAAQAGTSPPRRRRAPGARTSRAGRPTPGGPRSRGARAPGRRGRAGAATSTATSAAIQSSPRAEVQRARRQHPAEERRDGGGPHAGRAPSPGRRRTTVAPHPPRVGGASSNPATPGQSARIRRTSARWTPRPRPWTMRTSTEPGPPGVVEVLGHHLLRVLGPEAVEVEHVGQREGHRLERDTVARARRRPPRAPRPPLRSLSPASRTPARSPLWPGILPLVPTAA